MKLTLLVVLNAGRSDRLGEGVASALDGPAEEDVGTVDTVLLSDLVNDLVVTLRGTGRTERRVSLGKNVVLLQPSDELGLRASEGELDLVCNC
jgi:hypothetical protein